MPAGSSSDRPARTPGPATASSAATDPGAKRWRWRRSRRCHARPTVRWLGDNDHGAGGMVEQPARNTDVQGGGAPAPPVADDHEASLALLGHAGQRFGGSLLVDDELDL